MDKKNNNFEISYEDERLKKLEQRYKDIVFQFKMANIKYILRCIFTLRVDKLIPTKRNKNDISLNDMINSIDKKIEELEISETNSNVNNDYENYFYTRLLTLKKKNYGLWKQDVQGFINSNKDKWKKKSELIFKYTPFMTSEKQKNWLFYITSIIEKLSDKSYNKFLNDPETIINKNLERFNNITQM